MAKKARSLVNRKLASGHLILGEELTAKEFGFDCVNVKISPELEQADPIPVLTGGEFVDEGTLNATISGEIIQAYDKDSATAWTWANRGTVQPFKYMPRADSDIYFTGQCQISPVEIGGNVNEANNTSFEFKCVGEPVLHSDGASQDWADPDKDFTPSGLED